MKFQKQEFSDRTEINSGFYDLLPDFLLIFTKQQKYKLFFRKPENRCEKPGHIFTCL